MDIIQFYKDYGIEYWTSGKNVTKGWCNVQCPHCNDPSNHLGYNLVEDKGFSCWKCGKHSVPETIAELAGVSIKKAKQIIKRYEGHSEAIVEPKKEIGTRPFKLPSGSTQLKKLHKEYLIKRGFDPDYLEKEWGLMGTGPVGFLEDQDFKLRLIIPIYWNGKMVSFQSRDVTGMAEVKYITAPPEFEIVHHKNVVYGKQEEWEDTGIIVEGATDVWRLGPMSLATFGTNFTPKQIRVIAKNFDRVITMFDPEPQAQERARQMRSELAFRGVKCRNIVLNCDPGDLKQEDADRIVKRIKKNKL